MVDFEKPLYILSHETRGGGREEEIPVLPLRVAKTLCRYGICGGEVEGLWGGDLIRQGEEDEAGAEAAVVEVEALGEGGAPVVACKS